MDMDFLRRRLSSDEINAMPLYHYTGPVHVIRCLEDWEQALAELEDPEEFIDAFLARKVQDPGDRKQIKKASDALVRRGFSWRQVSEGVARLRWGD